MLVLVQVANLGRHDDHSIRCTIYVIYRLWAKRYTEASFRGSARLAATRHFFHPLRSRLRMPGPRMAEASTRLPYGLFCRQLSKASPPHRTVLGVMYNQSPGPGP